MTAAPATPTFAARVEQVIADFQHAADSNAPVSNVLMAELKDLLASGSTAVTERDTMQAKIAAYEAGAAKLSHDVQADVASLTAASG